MNKIILFTYSLLEKMWGSDYLYNKNITDNKSIGEMWALSGLKPYESYVINNEYKGLSLSNLYSDHKELFGNENLPKFPILIKLLTTADLLSIQVHPDDEYAQKNEGSLGKTECWLILDKSNKSNIIIGHKCQNKNEIIKMIEDKSYEEKLNYVYPNVGDFYKIPSGTIHGLGKDLVLLEIQQSSDITYRFYDYDRKDKDGKLRDLHVDKALDVVSDKPYDSDIINIQNKEYGILCDNKYFTCTFQKINNELLIETNEKEYYLGSVSSGELKIDNHNLILGESFLIPSNCKDTIKGNGTIILTKTKI